MLNKKRHSFFPLTARLLLCLGVLCAVLTAAAAALADDAATLTARRALRRDLMRTAQNAADKSGQPALFGLLVIPVDFADARLPGNGDGLDLSDRLTSSRHESLHRYFQTASRGRLDLRTLQTPVIHLPGTRRDYSDVGLNGFTRTRALATEALEAVRDLGLEFRRLDMEGPDRIPGTGDDDGQVDGVLILHAGIGQENDPAAGLVQALQFFLAEPVISQGVSASFYAVASLRSGPGIWAHETGHLLGLEDRYDPVLRPGGESEVRARGGLGRFSLMASGAWGTGDGYGASLPDAYSCLQLGWYQARSLANGQGVADTLMSGVVSGQVHRLWSRGAAGPEFFLLETRDPAAAFPFDANVPGGNLLIYHVDETLPEGQGAADGTGVRHLRASLVEADDDLRLRRGEDDGRAEDLFPGPLGKIDFGPDTVPGSLGYQGPSRVGVTSITPVPGGVSYLATVWPGVHLDFSSAFFGVGDRVLDLVASSSGVPFSDLRCQVSAVTQPPWGAFADGRLTAAFDLEDDGQGRWRPAQPVVWIPAGAPGAEAFTGFMYSFTFDGQTAAERRNWYWNDNAGALDFAAAWPGQWTLAVPGDPGTRWHRWNGPPWLTGDATGVLACTGSEFLDSSAWPAVAYGNGAYTTLTSGELGPSVKAVRIMHGMAVEFLTEDTAMDGGLVVWVDPAGREVPAEPVGGWRGHISGQALNALHGRDALVEKDLEDEADIPLWRTDIIPVPGDAPGPWRLRLAFGSNSLWRDRGWFVAALDPVFTEPAAAAFEAAWEGSAGGTLTWTWPWDRTSPQRFLIQHRDSPDLPWQNAVDDLFHPGAGPSVFVLAGDRLDLFLAGEPRQRHELRVVGFLPKGRVTARPVVVFPDGGDGGPLTLGAPWPNPARGSVRFLVAIPPGGQGRLGIYDLGARRVMARTLGAGSHLLEWNGGDPQGRRVASGTYIIRLEGSGPAVMRKVVLIH